MLILIHVVAPSCSPSPALLNSADTQIKKAFITHVRVGPWCFVHWVNGCDMVSIVSAHDRHIMDQYLFHLESSAAGIFRVESLLSAQEDEISKTSQNTPLPAWICWWKSGASLLHSLFSSHIAFFLHLFFIPALPPPLFHLHLLSPAIITVFSCFSSLLSLSLFLSSLSKEPDVFLVWFIQMQRLRLRDSAAGRMHSARLQMEAYTSYCHSSCKWAFLIYTNRTFHFL